ncbi:hypothetical protein AVEN_33903-1 [Araneus ventricosus]|uniref:Uncharacterized protein n=1 Tax=Araneus ventricosus TaxID=182803 RepID=A0A4Y2EH41_ARAVE|nr:hypothetical protein AVEN_33903-1 [Araneus ventricosus]
MQHNRTVCGSATHQMAPPIRGTTGERTHSERRLCKRPITTRNVKKAFLSYTKSKSPPVHGKSEIIGERFIVKEESAASVGTRPWMPEGRSLILSIVFMLQLGIMEWPSRLG